MSDGIADILNKNSLRVMGLDRNLNSGGMLGQGEERTAWEPDSSPSVPRGTNAKLHPVSRHYVPLVCLLIPMGSELINLSCHPISLRWSSKNVLRARTAGVSGHHNRCSESSGKGFRCLAQKNDSSSIGFPRIRVAKVLACLCHPIMGNFKVGGCRKIVFFFTLGRK